MIQALSLNGLKHNLDHIPSSAHYLPLDSQGLWNEYWILSKAPQPIHHLTQYTTLLFLSVEHLCQSNGLSTFLSQKLTYLFAVSTQPIPWPLFLPKSSPSSSSPTQVSSSVLSWLGVNLPYFNYSSISDWYFGLEICSWQHSLLPCDQVFI